MQPSARIRLENDEDHTNDAVVVVVDDNDDDDPSISSRCSANAGVDRTIEA